MKSRIALLVSLSILVLSACSSPLSVVKRVITKEEPTNVLTGLPGINGPVLAVKIDDTPQAHPQVGIEKADVVYIEQVEGGLTRLAAIFSQYPQSLPEKVGPVRSARISDIEILAQYGRVGFAFSGAQSKLYPVINSANLVNLSADREPPTIYSRDPGRFAPTDMLLDPAKLVEKAINAEGAKIDSAKSVGWKFGSISLDKDSLVAIKAVPIDEADISWPASSYQVKWSAQEKAWLLSYRHSPNILANGAQIQMRSFIIQLVSITDSEFSDKFGGVTPLSHTVGQGAGYLLRDGYALPITWNRTDQTSGTSWSFVDGSEAIFAPSQIWVALTDKAPKFTESAPPASTK